MEVQMKRSHIILLCSFLIFIFLFSACGKKEKILATIGKGNSITDHQLISFYNQRYHKTIDTASYSEVKESLDKIIEDEIKIKAAYDMGLNKDSLLIKQVEEYRDNLMLQKLYKIKIIDQVINESLIRDFYNKSSKELEIQDFVIQVENSAKLEDKEEKKKKAEMIVEELTAGKDFNQLAKEYSQDPHINTMVKKISYTSINDPLQNAIFSLRKEQISDIIKDSKGFHIVKVKEIYQKDIEPLKQKRDEITKKLFYQLRPEIQQKSEQYINTLVEKANITWNEENLKKMCGNLSDIEPKDQKMGIIHDSLMSLSEKDKRLVLLTCKGKNITVHYLINNLSKHSPSRPFAVADIESMKNQITFLLKRDLIKGKALSLNLDTHKEVIKGLEMFKRKMLIRILNKRNILKPGEPTEEEVYNYFIKNRDDRYSHLKNRKFENIKDRTKRDLKTELYNQKKKKWLADKKKEYNVQVYDNVLKEIINEEKE